MDGIDIPSFIEAYGLPGLIILGLGWVVRALWGRLNEMTDARHSDHKEHANQMAEVTKSLDNAIRFIEGSGRG